MSDEALAGDVVAYAEWRFEPTGPQPEMIVVRSIVTGRVLHKFSMHIETPRQVLVEQIRALHILVTGDGAVAWIQEDFFARHGGLTAPPIAYDVYAVDVDGFHALSTDLPAVPRSIKVVGNVLSWAQGHARESFVLN